MFFNKLTESDFLKSLENNIEKQSSFDEELLKNKINQILTYLSCASESLKNVGLTKEAEMILAFKEMCPQDDSAIEGLTSEKMLKNLEEKGWVFNVDDSYCEDGPEPQLSQEELKKLRDLLKSS